MPAHTNGAFGMHDISFSPLGWYRIKSAKSCIAATTFALLTIAVCNCVIHLPRIYATSFSDKFVVSDIFSRYCVHSMPKQDPKPAKTTNDKANEAHFGCYDPSEGGSKTSSNKKPAAAVGGSHDPNETRSQQSRSSRSKGTYYDPT